MSEDGSVFKSYPGSKWRCWADTSYSQRDKLLARLGYPSYQAYLNSDLWKEIRRKKLLGQPKCHVCKEPASVVHHLVYNKGTLLGTQQKNLASMCYRCHQDVEVDDQGEKRTFSQARNRLKELKRLYKPVVVEPHPAPRKKNRPATRVEVSLLTKRRDTP